LVAKRTAIAGIVNAWIDGFQAVEYLRLLAPHAHAAGLAIGQKNTTELGTRGKTADLDFAIAEECGRYDECGDYTNVYGDNVIDTEYTDDA
jgi:hypothetical protein